jgi:hypothetical protein
MQSFGPLHRLRLTLSVRIAATCLIVLTVLPFTAPFSTFDLAEVTDTGDHGGSFCGAKESKESGPAIVVTLTGSLGAAAPAAEPAHGPSRKPLFVLRSVVIQV